MRIKSFVLISMMLTVLAFADETITLTGTVTGPQDKAVDAALIKVYGVSFQSNFKNGYKFILIGQTQSDSEGKFTFAVQDSQKYKPFYYTCIASKESLSYGWKSTYQQEDKINIRLTEPQKLIGFVNGPDGNPVADAEVRLALLSLKGDNNFTFGLDPIAEFAAKTCEQGRFEFNKLPEGSSFEFLIKKEGLAPLLTFKTNINPEKGLTYIIGQTDIMLMMQNPCTISGVALTKEGQTPVEGISITALQEGMPMTLFDIEPAKSAADGTFEITGLPPAKYQLRVIDNDQWIAEPVSVEVKSKVEVKLELQKGGLLEIKVVDSETNEPVREAHVNIMSQGTHQSEGCQTDASGIAKKQLAGGTYEVRAYKQGYANSNNTAVAIVENNKNASVEIKMQGPQKLKGIVKTPDGKPAEGVRVQVFPNNGPRSNVKTGADGCFALDWDPQDMGWTEGEFLFVAVDEKNSLAKTELIDADAKEITINLQNACTVGGKVLDENGKPLKDASARLSISGSRWSTTFGESVKSDDNGQYNFTCLPPEQKFYVNVSGPKGYGSDNKQFTTEPDAQQTAIEDITLKVANLTLTGQAVDADGKGLENIRVQIYGSGQPNDNVITDKNGIFKFENVCPGSVQLHAYTQSAEKHMYSNLRTEGGAQDIKIVLSAQGGYSRYEPKKPASLIGKDLPSLTDYGVEIPADANSVLVFIWDMNQRPSRHFIKELAANKDLQEAKETAVILLNASKVEKDSLTSWLTENNIAYPCGIISIDPENAKFNLGVQSLPWLILTDKNKKVAAEGFSINELEAKLN